MIKTKITKQTRPTLFILFLLVISTNVMTTEAGEDPFYRKGRSNNIGKPVRSELGDKSKVGSLLPETKLLEQSTDALPDPLKQEFQRWITVFNVFDSAWRPTLSYNAGENKTNAIEYVTIGFNDIARAYFFGTGWAASNEKWVSNKAINLLFYFHTVLEPTDINPSLDLDINANIGIDYEKFRDYLKRFNEKTKNENREIKVMWRDLPDDFLIHVPLKRSTDVSTEKQRRRAIFENKNLTKDQARLVLAKTSGQLYGEAVRQFTENWLWLYDADRLKKEGLSQAAINLFYEGEELIENFQPSAERQKFANSCLIQPPNWIGTPTAWACPLPLSNNSVMDCYCQTPSEIGAIIAGTPRRFARGLVCIIPDGSNCPMVHSEPIGTMCECSGIPNQFGQIH